MGDKTAYQKEEQQAIFQGKPVTVTHLTPILSPEQRAKRKCEVEHQLYEVFSKYGNARGKANKKAQGVLFHSHR